MNSNKLDNIISLPVTNECHSSKYVCSIVGLLNMCADHNAKVINKGTGLLLINEWAVLADIVEEVNTTIDEMTGITIYRIRYEICFY